MAFELTIEDFDKAIKELEQRAIKLEQDIGQTFWIFGAGTTHNPPTYPFRPFGVAVNRRPKTQSWQEWLKDKEKRVWIVNGRVHAICQASVILQKPEHYERCEHCIVYSDTTAWQSDAAFVAFANKDYERVECDRTCNRCTVREAA